MWSSGKTTQGTLKAIEKCYIHGYILKSLILINTLCNFQHGMAQCFSSHQGVSVQLVTCNRREWHIQIKTPFKMKGNITLFARSSKFKDKEQSLLLLFFSQWNARVKRELSDKHSYDTASSGHWYPWTKNTSVLLWGRHPAPALVPSHCATGCFDLSNHKASGMRCARSRARVEKKKEREELGIPLRALLLLKRATLSLHQATIATKSFKSV